MLPSFFSGDTFIQLQPILFGAAAVTVAALSGRQASADTAARLRAEHGLRTPDALQAATAISSSATALVTNDATFRKLPGVQIIVLDDLL